MAVLAENMQVATQTASASTLSPLLIFSAFAVQKEAVLVEKHGLDDKVMYIGAAAAPSSRQYAASFIEVASIEDLQMTRQQLETSVALYFREHDGENIELEDLLNSFPCSLPDLVVVCDKLEAEGKIAEA